MNTHHHIFEADNVGDLMSAVSDWSWQHTRRSVLEVLEEQLGPEARRLDRQGLRCRCCSCHTIPISTFNSFRCCTIH
ncbi:MAG: hypothetical protein M1376_11280, partial [Planctomycetes bacterium]|nr:hypothetical protein [Planctomycetota bacterium]